MLNGEEDKMAMTRIELDATALMRQANMTAHDYIMEAKREVNDLFPELSHAQRAPIIAAWAQAASLDFVGAVLSQHLGLIADQLQDIARGLNKDDYQT